jgi:DNA-binding ferritin-like protein
MDKTIKQLEEEIADKRKQEKLLKARVSKWRGEALEARRMLKSLITQYERIVKEYRKIVEDFQNHATKLFIVYIFNKIKTWKEGRRK